MLQSVKGKDEGGGNWGLRGEEVTRLNCETPQRRQEERGLGLLYGRLHCSFCHVLQILQ